MNKIIGLLCVAFLLLPAVAGELAGVTLPDRVAVNGKTLVLNGMGLREATFLKVDVYVAGLYLEHKSSDPQAILDSDGYRQITMHFVRKVGARKLVDAWNDDFEANAGKSLDRFQDRIQRFNGWMTDVTAGDTMTFTTMPDKGVEVRMNGAVKGTIPGKDFARLLLSIWLGDHPPNVGLKKGLLG